ncbi:MAG: hypothetical protein AAGU75_16935, partial [Bacillota bacterium]
MSEQFAENCTNEQEAKWEDGIPLDGKINPFQIMEDQYSQDFQLTHLVYDPIKFFDDEKDKFTNGRLEQFGHCFLLISACKQIKF